MSTFSGFSTHPYNTPTPSVSPPPGPSASASPEPATNPEREQSNDWLGGTNGATALAQSGKGTHAGLRESRREAILEYMRRYANGKFGRERVEAAVDGKTEQTTNGMEDVATEGTESQHLQHPAQPTTEEHIAYRSFLLSSQHRRLQRQDLATRDLIFAESLVRARSRLDDLYEEKATLEAKILRMEWERERYQAEHQVGVSEVEDRQEERRWEEWFRVGRGVEFSGGDGGVWDGAGEEEGGVDI